MMEICVDCGFRSEYGSLDEPNPVHEAAYLEALNREKRKPEIVIPETGEDAIIAFSKQACDFCGSTLAGSRYRAVFYE
jgi:hypothetical protein